MLRDHGVMVDHKTIFRWIQTYAAELEKRLRPHLSMSNGSWRVDKNPPYPNAVAEMKGDGELWRRSQLRQVKYLGNIVEQGHRRIGGKDIQGQSRFLAGPTTISTMQPSSCISISLLMNGTASSPLTPVET